MLSKRLLICCNLQFTNELFNSADTLTLKVRPDVDVELREHGCQLITRHLHTQFYNLSRHLVKTVSAGQASACLPCLAVHHCTITQVLASSAHCQYADSQSLSPLACYCREYQPGITACSTWSQVLCHAVLLTQPVELPSGLPHTDKQCSSQLSQAISRYVSASIDAHAHADTC